MFHIFCLICDGLSCSKDLFCAYCRLKIVKRQRTFYKREVEGVPHFYLFRWEEESDLFCRRLVYFLKNKGPGYFREWVKFFPVLSAQKDLVAVVPGISKKIKKNHALSLAVALEKLLGLCCVIELKRRHSGMLPQKRRSRKERLHLDTDRRHRLDCNWVFVDDVFVSGGTYNRVLNEVGEKPVAIYTLFYRPWLERKDVETVFFDFNDSFF